MKQPELGITTKGILTKIVDGDTVDVEIRKTVRVRLLDCWAPETRTKDPEEKAKGLQSKEHLSQVCPVGTEVVVHIPASEDGEIADVFTMGRVLGFVFVDAQDLSEIQVMAGNATRTKQG